MKKSIQNMFNDFCSEEDFSGVFSVSGSDRIIFERAYGYRNVAERLPCLVDTAFAIASGTKLFTGLAVCKLVDYGALSLDDRICDLLPHDLGLIDKRITLRHLLTHTSGVGDYIDEESDDCEEQLQALYDTYPVQLWTRIEYYLQMITRLPPKFEPGARYGYSNAGYILLGLVIEAVSGVSYQEFVRGSIIVPYGLTHTGFYRMDKLPANTALGYLDDGRTNIFSMPVIGGSDGGLYTCAGDMDKLWRSDAMMREFLDLWANRRGTGADRVYYTVGGDSGVDFFSAYFPRQRIVASAFGNTELNTFPLLERLFELI